MTDYAAPGGSPAALGFTASERISAGQCVRLSGPGQVAPTVIDNDFTFVGVAARDAGPADPVTVLCGAGVIHESRVTGGVVSGTALEATVTGYVTGHAAGAYQIGFAVSDPYPGPLGGNAVRWLSFR